MKTFNISSQNLYVVGCHGCAPTLHQDEESSFPQGRYFIVPENVMIVYLTPNGVQSQGSKNIKI